jgi:hypothetical protein
LISLRGSQQAQVLRLPQIQDCTFRYWYSKYSSLVSGDGCFGVDHLQGCSNTNELDWRTPAGVSSERCGGGDFCKGRPQEPSRQTKTSSGFLRWSWTLGARHSASRRAASCHAVLGTRSNGQSFAHSHLLDHSVRAIDAVLVLSRFFGCARLISRQEQRPLRAVYAWLVPRPGGRGSNGAGSLASCRLP